MLENNIRKLHKRQGKITTKGTTYNRALFIATTQARQRNAEFASVTHLNFMATSISFKYSDKLDDSDLEYQVRAEGGIYNNNSK